MALEKFRASPLPVPTPDYSQQYMTQLIRVIGLYFSQLDSQTPNQADSYRALNFYGGLFSGDGYGLRLPHIAASDSTDQIAGGNDTPTLVNWNTLDSGYGWTLNAPGSATATYAGIYKITYSIQFANTANTIHNATVWLRNNGNDIANSATFFSIPARKSAGNPAFICGYSEITFQVAVGDEIELYWATDQAYDDSPATDGVYLHHEAAQTVPYAHPAVPSVVGSITFVSAIP